MVKKLSSRVTPPLLMLVCWCHALPAAAQAAHGATPPAAAPAARTVTSMEELARRLEALKEEVRSLRGQLALAQVQSQGQAQSHGQDLTRSDGHDLARSEGTSTPAAPAVEEPDVHHAAAGISTSDKGWESPTAQIHWFSDVGAQMSSRPGSTTSFAVGQLDLFLTSRLTEDLSVLSEIVFRAQSDNRIVVNPERLLLQYSPFDALQLSAGRFHSAVGYYNAAYHHGSWFETAATRPSVFSGGLIPIHNVGLSATGAVPSGQLGLRYIAEIGNGQTSRATNIEPTQNVLDENNTKAINLGLIARPIPLPGFQAGVSWYRDRLSPQGLPRVRQDVIAAHAVYQSGALEFLNEVVSVRAAPDSSFETDVSYGWYSQVARRFGSARPYFRYQLVKGDPDDGLYRALGQRHGPVFGLRYELGRFAALKLQYERAMRTIGDSSHDAAMKLAFTF